MALRPQNRLEYTGWGKTMEGDSIYEAMETPSAILDEDYPIRQL